MVPTIGVLTCSIQMAKCTQKRAHPLCTPAALAAPAALSHFTCINCMFSPPVGGCAFAKTRVAAL